MSDSISLKRLAQQTGGNIHRLIISNKTDFLPLLKAQYAALLPQIRSAEAREQIQHDLEKKLKKNKGLAGQFAAYREEWFRITKIIEAEKEEKKRLAHKASEESAL
ncbi:MAG: hypothetical protein JXR18_00390 [Neptuniibacter sp.]